ncbi:MAG TPA: hypothetical protein VGC50_13045 [Gammaproteobacteria bacterium]|jgi:hypothetical protein
MRYLIIAAGLAAFGADAQPAAPFGYAYTMEQTARELELHVWEDDGPSLGFGFAGARVDYFTVEPVALRLYPGERYSLRRLRILARDLHGEVFAGAPLKLWLEAPEGLIDLSTFASEEPTLVALRPGIGRLWIESLLPRGTGTGELYRLPVVIIVR